MIGNKKNIRNVSLFITLCIIGGTTYAFQKLGLSDGLPLWSAGMRFLIAGFIMMGCSLCRKTFQIDRESVITGIQYGVFYFAIPFGIIYWVGQYLPSGLLSVLSASVSVFSVIFNCFFINEGTTKRQIHGIAISITGILIIFAQSIFASYKTNMLFYLVICVFAYSGAAYATAYLKSKIARIHQVCFNITSLLVVGGLLCFTSLLVEGGNRTFTGSSLFSLIYLAIAGSMLATRITTFLLGEWNIAKVTTYRYISPVISLMVGYVFWKELLSTNEVIGVVFIILGTIIINRK